LPDYGLSATNLPPFRYVMAGELAIARSKNPGHFAPIDASKNADHTRELVGFLPWAIVENYGKLKSGFSYLKTFQEHGTPEEISNAQQNVIYIMGVMGHYIGDAVQPLHTTKHFNGWVGDNPKGYTSWNGFHSLIDGTFIKTSGLKAEDLVPKVKQVKPLWATNPNNKGEDIFPQVMAFILEQNKMVEPLYVMDKERKFRKDSDPKEGREFISAQMLKGGEFLGGLWLTAWEQAGPDTFLKARLLDRQVKTEKKP